MALVEIKSISYFSIFVTNLARSIEWYERVLGLGVLSSGQTSCVVGHDYVRVEMFQRPDALPPECPESLLIVAHIAFAVGGHRLGKAWAALSGGGIEVAPSNSQGTIDSIFIHDPDGHEIELVA